MSNIDTTSGNSAPRQSDPDRDNRSGSQQDAGRTEAPIHIHNTQEQHPAHPDGSGDAHGHSHDDHDHDEHDHHDHGEHDRERPKERRRKEPSENPENLSEQLVAGTLRGRRSKCSHGCGSDGGCSTGGCGVSSLVEMIANRFDYVDTRRIVEVTYPGYRRGFAVVEEDVPLRVRDTVIVRSSAGTDWGTVSMTGSLVHAKRKAKRLSNEELPELLRRADENDLKRIEQCKVSERHAFSVCRTRVESFNLPMILVGSEWQFDHKKLTFFFTADGRVDFRELVRDLAAIFNTRIELRQIPVRDAAKRIGGMGVCGLELCCTTHLGRYEHVTLDHAKIQQIPANPSKLSGQCGRLKCCLLYEVDTYVEGLKRFPPLESTIQTEVGLGVIQKIDLFRDLIHLYHASTSAWETLTLEDYRDIMAGRKRKKEPEPEKPSLAAVAARAEREGPGRDEPKGEKKDRRESGAKGERKEERKGGAKSLPAEQKKQGGKKEREEGGRENREGKKEQKKEGGVNPRRQGNGASGAEAGREGPPAANGPDRAASGAAAQGEGNARRRKRKRGGKKKEGEEGGGIRTPQPQNPEAGERTGGAEA